uniref:T-cell surface glycoprotein CD4 n=1 Tax=Dicentrarchus labrax TaxID=13489 RepID=B3CJQ7_DICLA|nr:T-cell surface glycoprotein CD4 [Dicentrarchus labrax]
MSCVLGTLCTQQLLHVTEMKNFIQSVLILITVVMSAAGEELIYAEEGQMVTLNPPAVTNPQTHYSYWVFNGNQIAWRNPFSGKGVNDKDSLSLTDGSVLVITNIQQNLFGTFTCQIYTSGNRDTPVDTTTYKILKLSVTMDPPSPLLPGEDLSLNCNAGRNPKIHWLNPQGQKINSQRIQQKATGQDKGEWTCVVTYSNKESKAKISVTLVDLTTAPSHLQYTSKSSPLTIPCSTTATWDTIKTRDIEGGKREFFAKPGASLKSNAPQMLFSLSLDPLKWTPDQDNELRYDPKLQKGILSLKRNQGKDGDSGDYVCSLKFKNGVTLNRTVTVHVLQITSSPGIELISGQQVNLTCDLGSPLPSDLQLKWFPPGQSSLPSLKSDHHPTHLIIPEVGMGDGGKWRCELWRNSTRLTSAVITLKIEPKITVWMIVLICSVTVIAILLLVVAFILYRRRQRKMTHLRHRLCRCKNPQPRGFYRS